jgi:hypothetical protein
MLQSKDFEPLLLSLSTHSSSISLSLSPSHTHPLTLSPLNGSTDRSSNSRPQVNPIKLFFFVRRPTKLECLSLASLSMPSLKYLGKARSLPFKTLPFKLGTNIRLGWKGANALAYSATLVTSVTSVTSRRRLVDGEKSFVLLATRRNVLGHSDLVCP